MNNHDFVLKASHLFVSGPTSGHQVQVETSETQDWYQK